MEHYSRQAVIPGTENTKARLTAYGLAVKYVFECERFDQNFCGNGRDLHLSRKNAAKTFRHVMKLAEHHGIPKENAQHIIRGLNNSPRKFTFEEFRQDYIAVETLLAEEAEFD